MRKFIADRLTSFADWIHKKAETPLPSSTSSTGFLDAYNRVKNPTNRELLAELKNTAWACVSINASVCANNPPKLYVKTGPRDAPTKCVTKSLAVDHPFRKAFLGKAKIEEVIEHPLLSLLQRVNPVHNAFDLWELTQFFMEAHGSAYWLLRFNDFLGTPNEIWILPSHQVYPHREVQSQNIVDYYEYQNGSQHLRFSPDEIIHFRFPDPRDPYCGGLSPLRSCFEQVSLMSQYTAMKRAIYDNTGIPSVILTPSEVISPEERERVEQQWSQKFRKGGNGRALVTESEMKLQILSHSMGDLAALAEVRATKEDIANAFHVPVPYLSRETNLANMEAAEMIHMKLAIGPRLRRRDEKLNEQLLPHYDPTGRLFLMSEDPTPTNQAALLRQQENDIRLGIRTINEVRQERGMPPVSWGDGPGVNT